MTMHHTVGNEGVLKLFREFFDYEPAAFLNSLKEFDDDFEDKKGSWWTFWNSALLFAFLYDKAAEHLLSLNIDKLVAELFTQFIHQQITPTVLYDIL